MAFDNTKLSYFHSFSKMPAQNSTSLGNAINKSGHTVTASEVWSQDIPYYGKMGSLADVITKVQPYARKNDMCYITAGDDKGKTFQYDGEGNWTDITTTLVDGALIKNANDDVVLLYHKGQTLTNLTADNNANTDSADNAARLWAKRAKDGSQLPEGETRLIEQFVAPTDKALNGLASVAYAPVIANGSLVSGTGYYDYCFSGTILWATARTASTLIDCFEYVGGKVSDVVDTVASHASTIATHTSEISELKEKLGIEDDDNPDSGSTPTLGGRVTALEDAVETLNGDATTEGSIAKSIKDAIDNLGDVAVKDDIKITDIKVQIGAGEAISLTPDENKSVTITIPEVEKATVSADGVITTGDEAKLVTATDAQNIAKKEASDAITAAVADGSVIDSRIDEVINAATLADGEKIATTTNTTKLVTVEDVTTYVSENAKVTLTQGTGITVTPNGEASTAFTVAVDDTVATAQSVTDLAGRVSDTEDAIESLTTGDNSVASQIANATLSATSTGGDKVTVTLGGTVSAPTLSVDESDIASAQTLNEVKNTADSAVQTVTGDTYVTATKTGTGVTLSTQISAIDAALADESSEVGAAIKAAASASTTLGSTTISSNDTDTGIKVELGGTVAAPTVDVTVTAASLNNDNKSFTTETSSNFAKASDVVTVATTIAAEKVASIETTGTEEIEANAESTSTKLATEASVAKTAQTLTTAIDAIAGVGVSYQVLGDNEKHESVTAPVKGRIYLEKDETAADGTYIEWFYTGTAWEKIGSTKADHSVYAKTITINKEIKTVSNNAVDLGKAVTSVTAGNGITSGSVSDTGALSLILDEADTNKKGIVQLASTHDAADTTKAATGATVAAAISGIAEANASDNGVTVTTAGGSVTGVEVATTSLVNEGALVESVTDSNLITAADALAAIKLAKPDNYVASVTVGSVTTSGETALTINDGRETVYANDLWGTTVSMMGDTITVQGGPIDGTAWGAKNGYNTKSSVDVNGITYPRGSNPITKVENNMVYNGTTEVANIKTNELVNGSYMFYNTSLTSFSGDLSSLTEGSWMFPFTGLTSFSGDLSNLVNGSCMFCGTPLKSFNGDLSSLVNGDSMFYNTKLTSFSGDLSNLVDGSHMFAQYTPLESFSGDLSSLVNGYGMFANTPLASFSGDLSSLVIGVDMFSYGTTLASFSGDLSSLVDGEDMFSYNGTLTSFSGDLSSLVDGSSMFYYCSSLASFSGDLSSLVNGHGMFALTSLDLESVELICDVLPNYNTENGGKQLQTATWNESEGKYTYSDWTEAGTFYYPIIIITSNTDSMSQGNSDGIDRSFGTWSINRSNVKTITISWDDISVLSEADRTAITKLFTDTATEKGWTFTTNGELGGTVSPNAVMTTDGTIQYYVFAKKDEATEDDATHIDASGKLWKFDTAEAIIGPNIKYWSMFATVEDALTEWGLTPWTKPTEEETEA